MESQGIGDDQSLVQMEKSQLHGCEEEERASLRCIHEVDVAFPYPIKTIASSCSFIGFLFECGDDQAPHWLIAIFQTVPFSPETLTGLQFHASISVDLKRMNKDGTHLNQAMVIYETDSFSYELVLPSFIAPSSVTCEDKSVHVLEEKGNQSLVVKQRLETAANSTCLLLDQDRLFVGDGCGCITVFARDTDHKAWSEALHHLSTGSSPKSGMCQLLLSKEDTQMKTSGSRLISLSEDGTMSIFNLNKMDLVSVFRPTAVKIINIQCVHTTPNEQPSGHPQITLMAILSKLQDRKGNRLLCPLSVSGKTLQVGASFPIEDARCLFVSLEHALVATSKRDIVLWQLHQGHRQWSYMCTSSACVIGLTFKPETRAVQAILQTGRLLQWFLAK